MSKDGISGRQLESELENLKDTLIDQSLSWRDTYVQTSPFEYLQTVNLTGIAGRLNAQAVLGLFLKRKGIGIVPLKNMRMTIIWFCLLNPIISMPIPVLLKE
ncbi:hypothetical protein MKJ01_11645 [Chryseobacterium sp. SSA4.19]|uniref:hypothetical protein n=1 Tax=Chryseobacterium sp. SSA4.19 TaxID=2919915 RepID=UPI001F4EC22D|nr:hypothetical protein [Chryseobacterium sp. SSA4.19]MCJ8154415.1 hypothetical protein [Chryseobacterium sp. SSA4.19]